MLPLPTFIDHIFTNHPKCCLYETSLSDFHKLTFTVLKMYYVKQKLKIIKYRDYIHIDSDSFRSDLLE